MKMYPRTLWKQDLMIWDFIQTNPISKYSAYLDWNIADKSECLHCIESRLKMKLKNSNCWIIVDLNIPYHVLTKVWSDIDQIFDHQILLSKFTSKASDGWTSDKLVMSKGQAQWTMKKWSTNLVSQYNCNPKHMGMIFFQPRLYLPT